MDLTLFKKPLSFPCCVLAIATCLFSACKEPEPDIKPEDALLIEFTEKTLSNKASEFSMDVTANCDWTFTVDANWAYIIEPRSQYNGSKKLTIGVLKNETTSERTATFVFQYSKGSAVLKVIQTAFEVYLNVSVQDVLFGYRNAEKVITVTSNCGWDAKSDQEWLAIKPITGLVGSFEMTLETGTNDGTADRTAQVRIWNTKYGLSQVVSVTQLKRNGTNIKDYVDEYGINRGEGLIIGELEWAPVNCGYHETEYTYGKVYQWGRKQGVGYHDDETSDPAPTYTAETWSGDNGAEDPATFYLYSDKSRFNYDWILKGDNSFWNKGTEQNPIKNETYDPCPEGWRIPTAYEFNRLLAFATQQWRTRDDTVNGLELSSGDKTLFLPAGGRINALDGLSYDRKIEGYYWTISSSEGSSPYLYFFEGGTSVNLHGSRAGGCSVRCIKE